MVSSGRIGAKCIYLSLILPIMKIAKINWKTHK